MSQSKILYNQKIKEFQPLPSALERVMYQAVNAKNQVIEGVLSNFYNLPVDSKELKEKVKSECELVRREGSMREYIHVKGSSIGHIEEGYEVSENGGWKWKCQFVPKLIDIPNERR